MACCPPVDEKLEGHTMFLEKANKSSPLVANLAKEAVEVHEPKITYIAHGLTRE